MARIVLVAPDIHFERQVQFLVGEDMLVLPVVEPGAFAERISRMTSRPELLVFGRQVDRSDALALAVAARQLVETMALVSDDDMLVDAMRAGISELLPTNADLDTVASTLARSHEFAEQLTPKPEVARLTGAPGRIIAVASPKGGVGKTTIACNVAIGLARVQTDATVIVDLDLQFGDVASTLDLHPTYSIEDAVSRPAARDSLVLRTVLTRHPEGFFVVSAPDQPATADSITAVQVAHLIEQLADEFRFVVVDTAPGLTEVTLAVLERATDLVMITSMDVSSVRGMRKELDSLGELGLLPEARHTVLNFAERSTGLSVADVEAAIGARVDIVIARSRAVTLATNRGLPIVLDDPRDRAARALRLLVRRLESTMTRKSWRQASKKERVS